MKNNRWIICFDFETDLPDKDLCNPVQLAAVPIDPETLEVKKGERIYGPILLGYPKVNPSESQVSTLAELRQKKKDPIIKWI